MPAPHNLFHSLRLEQHSQQPFKIASGLDYAGLGLCWAWIMLGLDYAGLCQ